MPTTSPVERRLLLVHAHPDDESIGTGATMARYVAEGAQVSLVTCTLGEEGEVLVPSLAQLAADEADQLGGWRIAELAAAMAELGVTDHRFLGGAGRFRDSGMMGLPANAKPRAFWQADQDGGVFDAAVTAMVELIRELRPQVMITYDDFGGYGHPDHIMAHRVAMAGAQAAADADYPAAGAPWRVAKLYWTAMPRSVMQAQLDALRAAGESSPFEGVESVDDLAFVIDDVLVSTVIEAPEHGAAKMRALARHATQITVDGPFFALSNNLGQQVMGTEYFRLVVGEPAGDTDPHGRETDLFAGIGPDEPEEPA